MVTFDYNQEGKSITLIFTGRMDYQAAGEISEILLSEPVMKTRTPEESIIFDIGGVDYIASSFIRICIQYAKLAGSGRFSIVNCQPLVKKTFKISGLDETLHIT